MWWRFITFCVLVSFVLFVVLSCIHGRPVIQLFFHRCCEDDIENDQVIFENFGNNFLRERLVGNDLVVDDNDSFVSDLEVEDVINAMRAKLNVHDPKNREELDVLTLNDSEINDNDTTSDLLKKITEFAKELQGLDDKSSFKNFENVTFNDVLSDSEERVVEEKIAKNDVLRELYSDENSSPEVTTERLAAKTKVLPIKFIKIQELIDNHRAIK